MKKVPELAYSCNQGDDYLNYHHKNQIQQLMEADVDIHS